LGHSGEVEPPPERLHSLDQFRGYTVAAMFLVNFLGDFSAVHPLLKHRNTYCSYADTIMPQFFFAVGFALRLAFMRHAASAGLGPARWRLVKRCLGLIVVGAIVYHVNGTTFTWHRSLFQALVHIGVTSLWVLPVIGASARAQVLWMTASAALHIWLSAAWWHDWLRANRVVDGGPLGFLTWTIPVLFGSLAYIYLNERGRPAAYTRFLYASVLAMAAGYGLSCLSNGGVIAAPPFVSPWHARDMWTMSQQAGSVSYLLFSAGFSLLVYTFFLWLADERGQRFAIFRALGVNALAGYILHIFIADAVAAFVPRDAALPVVLLAFAVFFGVVWAALWLMERRRILIRL
jgi:predicted acyltransferase